MAELVKIESKADMLFTPRAGYITKVLGYDEEGNITEIVKKSDGTFVTVGGGGGSSDAYVVVEENGVLKAQKLAFDGTTASDDGSPEDIGTVGIFATGKDEPAYKGSGGGSFYKCASVDGTTWSGNKAFQNEDGTWDFESAVTSDLEFGLGYTPEVGKVYNADATIKIESLAGTIPIPTDYKLYIPFNDIMSKAETGQSIETQSGNISLATKSGLPMTCFDTNTWARTRLDPSIGDGDTMPNTSWSFWYCREQANSSACELMTSDGSNYAGRLYIGQGNISFNGATIYYPFENNTVYHICIVASGFSQPETGAVSYYINGQFAGINQTAGYWNYPPRNVLEIHVESTSNGAVNTTSYFAGLRFYDRCITEDEIKALSKEFIPIND